MACSWGMEEVWQPEGLTGEGSSGSPKLSRWGKIVLPSSVTAMPCHPIHYGMIATGDHQDFGFAARSTTPEGKALAL